MAQQRHCRRLARNGKPGASLLTPSSNQCPDPRGKPDSQRSKAEAGERQTVCWRERDSNPRSPQERQDKRCVNVRSSRVVYTRESGCGPGFRFSGHLRDSAFSRRGSVRSGGPTSLDRSAKRRRRTAICRYECVVEPPHAAKPGGEGYVGRPHRGLID